MKKNQPVEKFRAGAICATVWNNSKEVEGKEPRTYSTISLERSYKDKEDQWQSTRSFRVNDLPKAAMVLQKAFEYLTMEKKEAEA